MDDSKELLTYALGEDGALGNKQDVLVGELLLKLANQARRDLLEALVQAERHKDDQGLLAGTDIDLLDGRDVQVLQVSGQILGGVLQVGQGLKPGFESHTTASDELRRRLRSMGTLKRNKDAEYPKG